MKLEKGIVKWFHNAKGFGFITREEDGADVFVHYSAIQADGYRSLLGGEVVYYQLKSGSKGLYAAIAVPTRLVSSDSLKQLLPETIDYVKDAPLQTAIAGQPIAAQAKMHN